MTNYCNNVELHSTFMDMNQSLNRLNVECRVGTTSSRSSKLGWLVRMMRYYTCTHPLLSVDSRDRYGRDTKRLVLKKKKKKKGSHVGAGVHHLKWQSLYKCLSAAPFKPDTTFLYLLSVDLERLWGMEGKS
ncbi:hypothetical protein AMECASPLE_019438 [Ameca splendens]|uniref:Uncharacterized protein n=1 Tax=Ameca splendens TaxID=208324 RepID=A0ABV1AAT3_9TELE